MSKSTHTHTQNLIAHYLKQNGLNDTLRAFELELNKKLNIDVVDESLQTIINDRFNFLNLKLQHMELIDDDDFSNNDDEFKIFTPQNLALIKSKNINIPKWSILSPNSKDVLKLGNLKSLIIHSSSALMKLRDDDDAVINVGLYITNDKNLIIQDLDSKNVLVSKSNLHDSVANKLIHAIPNTNIVLSCGMNGQLIIARLVKDESSGCYDLSPELKIQLHKRLITSISYLPIDSNSGYISSIGWDFKLIVNKITFNSDTIIECIPISDYKLMTNGSCITSFIDLESNLPIILIGRLDTSMISVFTIYNDLKLLEIAKLSLNDSEFSNHSFQPMNITMVDPIQNLITFATNHIPYMRLITIKFPSILEILSNYDDFTTLDSKILEISKIQTLEQSFQSNIPILRNIIISNLNSMSPQDKFSSPLIISRPFNKNGLWIFGDDGIIRGFDLSSGDVIEELKTHEGRIKSGFVSNGGETNELLISCGAVDREVVMWQ
ncbi:hypothetical protein CANARDRAFT_178131 [[Candida] arabinofermentans NRRL YB-2248]|uniref:Uncharacterized protein n=1 Tax=[Candida] arabinofermentans NRRL YB-2248 TaxID=983967 RepID=A0A1E4STT0_9ASCO|nr:hypothetical protein CANARDRAFT_178131 [[Candida] arabinofermentans NRRL YB-2248]